MDDRMYIVVAPNGKVVYAGSDQDAAYNYMPAPDQTGDTYKCYLIPNAVVLWGENGP